MDRFKWFDFLGALILLFSVTKSAITPQGVSGDSDTLDTPPIPAGQRADLYQFPLEGITDVQVNTIGSSVNSFLEGDSRSFGFQYGVAGERKEAIDPFFSRVSNPSLTLEMGERAKSLNPPFALGYSQMCSSAKVPVFSR